MKLAVTKRIIKKKAVKKMRKEEQIPWVVYGKHMDKAIEVAFDKQAFIKLYKKAGSTPITLKGDDVDQMVLVHAIQLDPVTDYLLHVDFLALTKGEKVSSTVSIILEWESPIEKSGDGRVQQVKSEVVVEALPKDLPQELTIDISGLETTNDVLFLKDIKLPKWVEILDDVEISIVTIASLKGEEVAEEEEAATEDVAADGSDKVEAAEKEAATEKKD